MGDRIQRIASIIFALMFIAVLSLIHSNIISVGNSVNNQLSRTYATTEMHELMSFNGEQVTGATVISAINNYDNLCDVQMCIVVDNSNTVKSYGVNPNDGTFAGETYTVTSSSDSTYISPADVYDASLITNSNGVYTKVYFTKHQIN